jgi:mono/diheme cytochrome c family protein
MKPLWLAWLLGLVLSACSGGGEPAPGDPLEDVFNRQAQEEGLSRAQTEGKRVFVHYCVTCHGDEGHGDGQNAYSLDPNPPDFETSLSKNPPSYWRAIIEGGTASVGRSPLCPPWGRTLNGASIDNLVSYLELLGKPKSPPVEQAPEEGTESPPAQN